MDKSGLNFTESQAIIRETDQQFVDAPSGKQEALALLAIVTIVFHCSSSLIYRATPTANITICKENSKQMESLISLNTLCHFVSYVYVVLE